MGGVQFYVWGAIAPPSHPLELPLLCDSRSSCAVNMSASNNLLLCLSNYATFKQIYLINNSSAYYQRLINFSPEVLVIVARKSVQAPVGNILKNNTVVAKFPDCTQHCDNVWET